jgi:hypothetical protein
VKKTVLAVFAAIMFLNVLIVPTVANADNGTGQCPNGTICKP